MAFDTYQDLKDAVKGWLNREDSTVTDRIPDFIVFAENRIFRNLRTRFNEEKEVYPTGFTNPDGITLPADYKETKLLTYDGFPVVRKSEQWFLSKEPTEAAPGQPKFFARTTKSLIEFWPPPDNDAEVVMYYYEKQGPISDTVVPTLYLEFPELYLFGALLEALPYLKNTEWSAVWTARFEEALNDVQTDSDEDEYSGSTVEVSVPYPDGQRDYGTNF